MTVERRVDRLEGGLPPKEATLLWLEDAHTHGSLVEHCVWLVDRPRADAPLERIRRQALTAVHEAMRGSTVERLEDARQQATRDVAFLFGLVMRTNTIAEETIRVGGLQYGMLFWEIRAISAEARDEDPRDPHGPRPTIEERRARWRVNVVALRAHLGAQEGAFDLLEGRYLDGHVTLFPDVVERWERLREAVEDLASLGGPVDAEPPAPRPDPEAAVAEAERMADEVRAHALDIVGDVTGSAAIMEPRLRGSTGGSA